jgi:hypothetical protein
MMDEFGLYPREEAFDPLGVILFKALQVIAFLFFIALLAVSPDSKDGKKIPSPIREEIVTVRGIVPGEYTVNVSHFQATTGEPVSVNVKVQKLNPTAQVIFDNKLTLDHTGEEKTALRFWLNAEGKVIDVQQRQKSLLETFRNVRANGADLDPKTGVRMPRRE